MPEKFTKRKDPTVMFANCGHGIHRRIEDSIRFNFLSAGQGKQEKQKPYFFSNQIRNLIKGDILAIYRNKIGFVGIARVMSKPMTITEAIIREKKAFEIQYSQHSNMLENSEDPEFAECLIEIEWLTRKEDIIDKEIKGGGYCYGGDTPRNVTCELSQTKYRSLEEKLQINFSKLLKNEKDLIETEKNFQQIHDKEVTFPEGKEVYRMHKSKERNIELVQKAKENYFFIDPKMKCEVCDISFLDKYGEIGRGFIEAHHTKPISELKAETETSITDLAFVCSNCHQMLHRRRPWLSKDDLKLILL